MKRNARLLLSSLVIVAILWAATFPGAWAAPSNQGNLSSTLSLAAPMHSHTTLAMNPQQSASYVARKAQTSFDSLSPRNTDLKLRVSLSPEAESSTDLSAKAEGTLTLAGRALKLTDLRGHLSWTNTKSGQMLHGMIHGKIPDATEIAITTTYNPKTHESWLIAFLGTINSESGFVTFGVPAQAAIKDVPEALNSEYEALHGPKPEVEPITAPSAQGCGDTGAEYVTPPDPANQGDNYRGRRMQRIVSSCGYRLGAVMLWAPDSVGRGDSLQYGARVWSDTAGATQLFQSLYGNGVKGKTATVYEATIGLTANPAFHNSGATAPQVGQSGTYLQIPLAKLASMAGCSLCWWVPNPSIPLKVSTSEIRSVNGGTNNQFYVDHWTALSFNPTYTNYSNANAPWGDEKGFAAMAPFARDTTLTSPTYLSHSLYSTIYYRIDYALGGPVIFAAAGPTMSWFQRNVP